jgi:putative ABC transport system permease protein
MMLRISRQTVRHSWRPYAGAFVALACGVVLITTTVLLLGAVDATASRDGVSAAERAQLEDLSSLFGTMAAVSMFMALFVVASTFGFVVATRRRELGLLRLVGATPRQVRRMVLGEALVVALLATVVGSLVATALAPAVTSMLRAGGVTSLELDLPSPYVAWAVAAGCGIGVALLGSWRASRRASKIAPVAAFQEAGFERRRVTPWQFVIGTLCLGGVVAAFVAVPEITPLFALVGAVLLPEVVVVGLMCFGGLIFPKLAGLLAGPAVRRDVAARLARDHLRTAVRTPAALAAPVVAISAIAGSMILALSFTADWTAALDREQLRAPLVVELDGSGSSLDKLREVPELEVVDPRVTAELGFGAEAEQTTVEAVDLSATPAARGLTAVRGDLGALENGQVAITETFALDSGSGFGDRLRIRVDGEWLRPKVGAVVRDAPDLYDEVLASTSLLAPELHDAVPIMAFVVPDDGVSIAEARTAVEEALAGTSSQVTEADAWIESVESETRAANDLALWVLLGPSALYAGIAIVNAVLIGSGQRRRERRTLALLGATAEQQRRTALWEAGLVGAAALVVGGAVVGLVGWMVRHAIVSDVPAVDLDLPVVPLLGIGVTCLGLTLLAAFVGARPVAAGRG